MSSLTNNAENSTVTAKSVLEKLKSLSSTVSKKATEEADIISSSIVKDTSTLTSSAPNSSNTLFTIFRYILIILLIGFIVLNILAILDLLPPNLTEIFSPLLLVLGYTPRKAPKQVTKQPVTATTTTDKKEPNKKISDKLSTIDAIEKDLERDVKNLKDLVTPDADMASSNIQSQNSKAGYCYVGEDRGYRSCVKVDEQMTCMSGDIFPTKDICVNPNLRA